MRRREVIAILGVSLVRPDVLRAEQTTKTPRIGVLFALAEDDRQAQARFAAFRGEMQKLGWGNIILDARYVASNDKETHQRYAKELVALQPDVLLAQNTDATEALFQQTKTIPIIFTIVADPIGSGFVESFARPGRNVTGFVTGFPTMGSKWLELLKEIAPDVTRVLVPFNASTRASEFYVQSIKTSAAHLGIEASATFVRDLTELEAALAEHGRNPLGGLVVIPDAYLTGHRSEVIALVARYHLPAIYPFRFFAESGGLLAYGTELIDNFRRAAIYADRILKGAKVSDLPVQAPEKFELLINLQTARSLDLAVPPRLLARADEVIE